MLKLYNIDKNAGGGRGSAVKSELFSEKDRLFVIFLAADNFSYPDPTP
jgi:hypothetical protein